MKECEYISVKLLRNFKETVRSQVYGPSATMGIKELASRSGIQVTRLWRILNTTPKITIDEVLKLIDCGALK